MKARTFRFDESDIELLKQLSDKLGVSQVDVLRRALRELAESNTKSNTSAIHDSDVDSPVVSALVEQLKVKDEQIAALTRTAEKAMDAAKGAQALHASDVMALESSEQKEERERRGLFRRIADALRG